MSNETYWRVIVTYGTYRDQTYCRVPSRESAESLKERAVALGYKDAAVWEDQEWAAEYARRERADGGRRDADSGRRRR